MICCSSNTNNSSEIYFKYIYDDMGIVNYVAFKNEKLFTGKQSYYHNDICGVPEILKMPEEIISRYFGADKKRLRIEENYKNGKLNGKSKYFKADYDGELHREITYLDGEVTGNIKVFPSHNGSAGVLSSTYEGPYLVVNQNDVSYNKVYSSFYCCNYKIKNYVTFQGEIFNGAVSYIDFNRFGHNKIENYNSGKLDGKTVCKYSNGIIKYIRFYTDGCPSGTWQSFDIDGNLISKTIYNWHLYNQYELQIKKISYFRKEVNGNLITKIKRIDYYCVRKGGSIGRKEKETYLVQQYNYDEKNMKLKSVKSQIYPNVWGFGDKLFEKFGESTINYF